MKLSLEQLQALNAINMLNAEQKAELERLEAGEQNTPVEDDEFNFEHRQMPKIYLIVKLHLLKRLCQSS